MYLYNNWFFCIYSTTRCPTALTWKCINRQVFLILIFFSSLHFVSRNNVEKSQTFHSLLPWARVFFNPVTTVQISGKGSLKPSSYQINISFCTKRRGWATVAVNTQGLRATIYIYIYNERRRISLFFFFTLPLLSSAVNSFRRSNRPDCFPP